MVVNELEARLQRRIKMLEARIDLLSSAVSRLSAANMNKSQVVGTVQKRLMPFDHGELAGLADDDHTQYFLLTGRAGGTTAIAGTGSGDDMTWQTTSHVTKGSYILSELTTAGYVKTTSGGVLSSSPTLTIPVYSQDGEPDIPNNSIALWIDTDGGPAYYLLADFGGTQKKVAVT